MVRSAACNLIKSVTESGRKVVGTEILIPIDFGTVLIPFRIISAMVSNVITEIMGTIPLEVILNLKATFFGLFGVLNFCSVYHTLRTTTSVGILSFR